MDEQAFIHLLMIHAPKSPLWDFKVIMSTHRPKVQLDENGNCINEQEIRDWDNDYIRAHQSQWPLEWAKSVIEQSKIYEAANNTT